MENTYGDAFGKFSGSLLENGQIISFFISPEIITASAAILPIRRFIVEVQHPQRGCFILVIYQNELCDWGCKSYPEFVTDDFIESLGNLIEHETAQYNTPVIMDHTFRNSI
ncbi:MAG: hypothetical protein ABIN89_16340 [Chitinophagaceae bacterium]